MEIYPPSHLTMEESLQEAKDFDVRVKEMNVSNDTLTEYVRTYISAYRQTVEEFFQPFASFIPFYSSFPFKTTVVRFGPNGVIIAHRPDSIPDVRIMHLQDFQPPLGSVNVIDIAARLEAKVVAFSLSVRAYDRSEAEACGTRDALTALLEHFWTILVPNVEAFESLCRQLLSAEGIVLDEHTNVDDDLGIAATGSVFLKEPAGFRRRERWGFQFRLYREERVSAKELRQAESVLLNKDLSLDVLCFLTTDDLTSLGRSILVQNPRLRVWDRTVLNLLVNEHPGIFSNYFKDYPIAVDEISRRFSTATSAGSVPTTVEQFQSRLAACPTGQKTSAIYEKIGIEIMSHLFPDSLGDPKAQDWTADGKQRRDVLFRNRRVGGFWQRIFDRFDADFVIVDFKNYGDPVPAGVIFDVEKYANAAVGRFVLVVSRHGRDQSVEAAQIRALRDRQIMIPVISDEQLIEMIQRKQNGQTAEDVLEDSVDEILRRY